MTVDRVERLARKLDEIHGGPSGWTMGRGDFGGDPDSTDWFLFADWTWSQFSPDQGWAVEVQGATIREVLIRGLWASR